MDKESLAISIETYGDYDDQPWHLIPCSWTYSTAVRKSGAGGKFTMGKVGLVWSRSRDALLHLAKVSQSFQFTPAIKDNRIGYVYIYIYIYVCIWYMYVHIYI